MVWLPATVPWSPAAIPATCVAWNDSVGSNGWFAYLYFGDGGENVLCTITFGVVNFVCPFGKPGGYANPLGLKYGFVASMPSSITAIFIPFPADANVGPHSLSAPICPGPAVTRSEWYRMFGQTAATPGSLASVASAPRGTTTATPFATSR